MIFLCMIIYCINCERCKAHIHTHTNNNKRIISVGYNFLRLIKFRFLALNEILIFLWVLKKSANLVKRADITLQVANRAVMT